MTAKEQFLEKLRQSLDNQTFVKLTLSKASGSDKSFRNVYGRPVLIKEETQLGFTLRYESRDITKNFNFDEGVSIVGEWLGEDF